jgi:hypothetical protein
VDLPIEIVRAGHRQLGGRASSETIGEKACRRFRDQIRNRQRLTIAYLGLHKPEMVLSCRCARAA